MGQQKENRFDGLIFIFCCSISQQIRIMKTVQKLILILAVTATFSQPIQLFSASTFVDSIPGPLTGSLLGGRTIYIKGVGFPSTPTNLEVMIGSYPCKVPADGITSTTISCETASSVSLVDKVNLPIKVIYEYEVYQLRGFTFSYLTSQTPTITDVIPSSSVGNKMLNFYGKHHVLNIGDGQRNMGDFLGIWAGDSLCGMFDIIQGEITYNGISAVKCLQAREQQAGKYNVSEHVVAGWATKQWRMQKPSLTKQYYEHTVLPSISTLAPNKGAISGQDIVIKGSGFSRDKTKMQATIDGVNCAISASTTTEISCRIAPKQPTNSASLASNSSQAPSSNYIAGTGFKYTRYDVKGLSAKTLSAFKAAVASNSVEIVSLQSGYASELQSANIYGDQYGQVFKGYFYAPVTGNYIFRGAADDAFTLLISSDYGTTGAALSQEIYDTQWSSSDQNYYISNHTSALGREKYLEAGKYYYMEAYHINFWGSGYFKVSVQVPNTNPAVSRKRYEVNQIQTTFTNDPQIMKFTLTGSTGGTFNLSIYRVDSATLQVTYNVQVKLNYNASASQFQNAINQFDIYASYDTTCTGVQAFDDVGTPATLATGTKFVWTVSIGRLRTTAHLAEKFTSKLSDLMRGTVAPTFTETRAKDHCPLIDGTFTLSLGATPIKIYDTVSKSYSIDAIPATVTASQLQAGLRQIVGFDKTQVVRLNDPLYGALWIISYYEYTGDVPDMVLSGSRLTGGATGTTPKVTFFQTRTYSPNVIFNPINQNFMFMAAAKPNVIVTVNGLKSVCLDNCEYTFLPDTPQVTSQILVGSTVQVTLSNPLNIAYPTSMLIAKVDGQNCQIISGTFASFTCQLPTNPNVSPVLRAGAYNVEIFLMQVGHLEIQSGVAPMNYALDITLVNSSTGGTNGGYEISLEGNGFPFVKEDAKITLCGVQATITYISNTLTKIIVPQCANAGAQAIKYEYNSLSDSDSFTYTNAPVGPTLISIYPQSASPVLKAVMTITGAGFGSDSSLVTIYLANSTGKIYQMRVLSTNDTQIRCGIPGGLPGKFDVKVSIAGHGDIIPINPAVDDFTYELVVSSVSPSTGAFYGGTLITISGRNFSPDVLQNLVHIGNELNWLCDIELLTPSQIRCRTPEYHPDWSTSTQGIVVNNRLIQDSECPTNNCKFTYSDLSVSPSLSAISTQSVVSGVGSITLTGMNLDAVATANVQVVLINKVTAAKTLVSVNSVTSTQIVFNVPSAQAGIYEVRARLDPIGQTNSYVINIKSSFSTTSYTGSIKGGNLVLVGQGLPSQWPSKLHSLKITSNSRDVDAVVVSTSTTKMELEIPLGMNNQVYTIQLKNPLQDTITATHTQLTSATPVIDILTPMPISTGMHTIQVDRTNLNTVNPSKIFIYNILAPAFTTEIQTWTYAASTISFSYPFKAGRYGLKLYYTAYGWADSSKYMDVSAPAAYTATTSQSSYLGGRLTVNGNEISADAVIKVGGFTGKVIQVTATQAIFSIPALITPTILGSYPQLQKVEKIQTTSYISDAADSGYAFDTKQSTYYYSNNSQCYIGIDAGAGRVVNVRRVRYFPYYKWVIAANYIKGAVIQASADGTTYSQIGQVDQTVHAGWNSLLVNTNITTNYRYIRLKHNNASGCKLSEFEVYGVLFNYLTIPNISSYITDAIFTDGYNQYTLAAAINYKTTATPVIDTISQLTGSVYGNQIITLTGSYLDIGTPKIFIDSVQCVVNPAATTSSQLQCTTGPRPTLPDSNMFVVQINGNRALAKQEFIYVMRWSDVRTWGTDLPPVEGDLVYVPKGMTLFVDQSTPRLDGIVVEDGKIIFADEKDMEIHTNLITVNRGEFRAGTEQKPYQNKLTFIMYGSYYGKQQPMFGNKGIGCMECKFSMHGTPRVKTWTMVANTINAGDATFDVMDTVDWVVGEQIVVASTDFDHNQAEQRTIVSVSGTTITVDQPFQFKHFGGVETYGSDTLQMRAEVGLLTRNIKMMGDPTSEAGQYGSHLMMAGSAENGLVSHIAYTEFTHCGQPRIVGRYCIHFHMNGDVADSYAKGNAVHHSFARVITLHGVHYLRVLENVGYRVKGHNFFIEDGIETQNVIEYNLVIGSLESWNMMQTDISVASYWITNPSNHLRFNRAAGGDFYGFWYQIKQHPDGPSATEDICPIGNPLGQSHDNVAHSYKRFGLRIFKLYSRQKPCEPIRDNSLQDPWSQNPSIESKFYNYVTYKNGQAGLLAEQVGHMVFQNFTIAQSYRAGMEFYRTNFTRPLVQARNMAIIGVTRSNPPANLSKFNNVAAVIGPRSSGWKMSNIRFYNFPSNMHILQTCSHCQSDKLYTNTAHEYLVSGISYTNVSGNYLRMNGLKRQIIYDLDGSFSQSFNGATPRPSATVVYSFKHLAQDSACTPASTPSLWDNSLICDQTAKVRRVMFTNLRQPFIFIRAPIKIQRLSDTNQVVAQDSTDFAQLYSCDSSGMQPMLDMKNSYAVAFIAGRIYNIWWLTGLDFIHLNMDISRMFDDSDPAIIFKFNYTQVRQLYEIGHLINGAVTSNLSSPTMNTSLDESTCEYSDYTHDVDNQTLTLCASSRGKVREFEYLDVLGIRCRYICPSETGEFVKQKFIRYWSNATQWPNGVIPTDGQNVTIPGEWTILIDIQPNIFGYWVILGDVIVPETMLNLHIVAQNIWIKSGSLKAGTSTQPHPGRIIIEIIGYKNDRSIVIDPEIAGNKMFVVTGKLQLYGQMPARAWTKLTSMARPGDTSIRVIDASGWGVGDQIAIAPSFSSSTQHQKVTITGINGTNISFSPALQYKHYGAPTVTVSNVVGDLDTRAGVGHLSRNIVIKSGQDSGWGYHLLVYGFMDGTILRAGSAVLRGVEFYEGGQYDTQATALRLFNTISTKAIEVSGSSFHDCKSFCIDIKNINNANIVNNVFYMGRLFHVRANELRQFTFENNLMIAATKRPTYLAFDQLIACYATYTPIHDRTVSIRHNLCQGADNHGFVLPYIPCDYIDTPPYDDNTVGSAIVGHVFNKISDSCLAATGAKAYACRIAHIASSPGTVQTIYTKFMMADSNRGVTLRFGKQGDDSTAYWRNSYVSAISRPTCSECYGTGAIQCNGGRGVRMLAVTVNGQMLPTIFGPGFDVICKQETFDAKAFLDDIIFENFNLQYRELPQCGNNAVFQPHSSASDMTGSHHLHNTVCNNCSLEALARFTPPLASHLGWFGGCGKILCTGKNNYLITDYTGQFLGTQGFLLANNSQIGDNTPNCTFIPAMNGHLCKRLDFGVIEYESIAPDFNTRIMWPVYLKFDGGLWNTTTNAWREWEWQGNQPLNKRLGRFVSVVQLNQVYNMTFQSEPPIDIRFQFQRRTVTGNNSEYIVIKLYYPRPNSIRVMNRGDVIKPISLLDNNGEAGLDNSICGSNKFFYQNYTVHFVLTGDKNCQVRVSLTNSIQLTARFSMDINDFFSNDGKTKFIDRMCAVLGIVDTSRLKIVGIYNGSVIIKAYIDEQLNTTADNATLNNNTQNQQQIAAINDKLNQLYKTGQLQSKLQEVRLPLVGMDSTLHFHWDEQEQGDLEAISQMRTSLIIGLTLGALGIVVAIIAGVIYVRRQRAKVDFMNQPTDHKIYDTVEDAHVSEYSKSGP